MSITLLHALIIPLFLFFFYGLRINKDEGFRLTKWQEIKYGNMFFWSTIDKNKIILSIAIALGMYLLFLLIINFIPPLLLNRGLFDVDVVQSSSFISTVLNLIVNILIIGILPSALMCLFSMLLKKNTLLISSIFSLIILSIIGNYEITILIFILLNLVVYLFAYFNNINANYEYEKKQGTYVINKILLFFRKDLVVANYELHELKSIMDISQVFVLMLTLTLFLGILV